MTKGSRTVTYALRTTTSGVPGLDKFSASLQRILDLQGRIQTQGDVVRGLRDQTTAAVQAAQQDAAAARSASNAKKQAANDYTNWWRQQLAAQAQATRTAAAEERRLTQEGTARLRAAGQTATMNARLSAQADREAAAIAKAGYKARQEAIDQVRLSMARLRAGLDDGLIGERAYHAQNLQLIATIRQMGESAGHSTAQLKQLADMHARLAREGNSVAGVVNPAGLSGNVASALSGTLPGLLQGLRGVTALSPSLGAAAARVSGVAQALQTVQVVAQGVAPQMLAVGRGTNTAAQAAGFLQSGASAAGGAVVNLGSASAAAGAVVGLLGAGLLAAGAAANKAVNEYVAYEYQLAKISTLTDRTKEQLGTVGAAIKQLSRDTGASMVDLSESVYDVLGASVKGADDLQSSMKLVKVAAEVAEAGFTETSVATDVLTSVLNAYKLSASDAGMVADKLFRTVDVGKISFRDLATSLGMVTSFAATAGVSLDEVLGAIAAMTANGVQGGQAIEYLRTMLGNMVAPSAQARALAHSLNLEYGEQALKAKGVAGVLRDVEKATGGSAGQLKVLLGDIGAVAAASAIATGNFERMDSSVRAVSNSVGAAGAAYTKVADTAQKQSERVAASWKTLWVNVGEVFAPFKLGFMTEVGEMLERVNTLLEKFNLARKVNGAQSGLENAQLDLSRQEGRAQRLRADLRNPESDVRTRAIAERDLPKVEADIRRLRAEIKQFREDAVTARADQAQYNLNNAQGALPKGMQGPQLPGYYDKQAAPVVGEEAGRFGYAFFEQMFKSGSVRGNPSIAAWCADVASQIQKNLGNNIKYTASAGGLRQNAIAAGYQKVGIAEARPGDLVFYNDPGVYGGRQANGQRSGNHVETVAQNVGGKITLFGANTTRNPTFKDFYDAAHATIYRAPTSPFAAKPDSSGGTKPEPMVSAAQIARAQALTAALDKAQDALKKDPGSVPLTQAIIKAKREMEAFRKASDGNADALDAIQKQGAKAGGTYIATAKDLRTYGAEALRLVKALEAAEKTGDPAQKALVERRIAAWQGESEARKAVFTAEGTAYKVRQQNRDKDAQDDRTAHDKAVRRQQELGQRQARLAEAARQGNIQNAQLELNGITALRDQELKEAGDNAAKKLAVEQKYAEDVRKAQRTLAQAQFADAKRDAQNRNDVNTQGDIARAQTTLTQAQQSADRDARNRVREATQVVQQESQKQAQAVTDLAQKYNAARTSLSKKAEAGTLTSEDMAAYAQQLAGYWGEAGKAGVKAQPQIAAAHKAAKAFADTALQINGKAIGSQIFEPVADGSSEARKAVNDVQVSLEELLALLPEGDTETAAFVDVIADLDRQGKLAAGALRGLNEAIVARAAERQGALDGYEALVGVLRDLESYGDGARGAGNRPEAAAQEFERLYEGLYTLDDATLQSQEGVQAVEDALKGAADQGAITTKQLDTLLVTLHALGDLKQNVDPDGLIAAVRADPEAYADGARGLSPRHEPLDRFEEFRSAIFGQADKLREDSGFGDWLAGELDKAREAGQLTVAQLDLLKKTLADIRAGGALEIAPTADEQRLDSWEQQLSSLIDDFQAGATSQDDFNERALESVVTLNRLADAAERNGNTDLAAQYRLFVAALVPMIQAGDTAADTLENLAEAQANEMTTSLSELIAKLQQGAISQQDFNEQALEVLPTLEKLAQAAEAAGNSEVAAYYREMAAGLRAVGGEALKASEKLKKVMSVGEQLQTFFTSASEALSLFGQDDMAQSAGDIAAGIGSGMQAVQGFSRVAAGDMTGLKDAVLGTLNMVNSFGEAILRLSPGFQKMKRDWQEISKLSKEALNVNAGGFVSPWQAALEQNAQNADRLNNASIWQRIGWGLFGGAPEVMSVEATKALASIQTLFGEFGSGVANIWQSTMSSAFDAGKMGDWAKDFDSQFDQLVGKTILKTMIEAAIEQGAVAQDLADLSKAVQEQRWGDVPAIMERVKAHARDALAPIAALAPTLPGYGSGKETAPAAGSLAERQATLSDLQDQYNKAPTQAERDRLKPQIDAVQADIDTMSGTSSSSGTSTSDTGASSRNRQELLYRYDNSSDPDEREAARQQLLALPENVTGTGAPGVIVRDAIGPDFNLLNTNIARLADAWTGAETVARMESDTAKMNRDTAQLMAQAGGMFTIAVERLLSGALPAKPAAGSINF